MYAIFETGGRQYWAGPEQVISVDRLDLEAGDTVEFDRILAVRENGDMRVGKPYVEGAKIVATVLRQGRERKIRVFTFRRKKSTKRLMGHRQDYTAVRIDEIMV
jgi:large subunit ribosomal protein L21